MCVSHPDCKGDAITVLGADKLQDTSESKLKDLEPNMLLVWNQEPVTSEAGESFTTIHLH